MTRASSRSDAPTSMIDPSHLCITCASSHALTYTPPPLSQQKAVEQQKASAPHSFLLERLQMREEQLRKTDAKLQTFLDKRGEVRESILP